MVNSADSFLAERVKVTTSGVYEDSKADPHSNRRTRLRYNAGDMIPLVDAVRYQVPYFANQVDGDPVTFDAPVATVDEPTTPEGEGEEANPNASGSDVSGNGSSGRSKSSRSKSPDSAVDSSATAIADAPSEPEATVETTEGATDEGNQAAG